MFYICPGTVLIVKNSRSWFDDLCEFMWYVRKDQRVF